MLIFFFGTRRKKYSILFLRNVFITVVITILYLCVFVLLLFIVEKKNKFNFILYPIPSGTHFTFVAIVVISLTWCFPPEMLFLLPRLLLLLLLLLLFITIVIIIIIYYYYYYIIMIILLLYYYYCFSCIIILFLLLFNLQKKNKFNFIL